MRTVHKILLLVLLAGQAASAQNSIVGFGAVLQRQQTGEKAEFIAKIKKRYLADSENLRRLTGDVEIPADSILKADILHSWGTLRVFGTVHGRIVSVNGDIRLFTGATVSDDVISVNGRIHRQKGARVSGEMVETIMRGAAIRNNYSPESPAGRSDDYLTENTAPEPESEESETGQSSALAEKKKSRHRMHTARHGKWARRFDHEDNMDLHYNRVDGLFVAAKVPPAYGYRNKTLNMDLNGFFGYGFAAKRWQYRGNLEFWLLGNASLVAGATLYDFTDTYDAWLIDEEENTLAAGLLREDFQDYFRRQGSGIYLTVKPLSSLQMKGGYYEDSYFSLDKNTDWSLFGGKKRFRENPRIQEGEARSWRAALELDTRDSDVSPFRGWFIRAETEWNTPQSAGWFDYDRFLLDVRHYIPVGLSENLDFRLRAGTSRGEVPVQSLFYLGGISSLRGYGYKEFAGNRMVLANIEYRLNSGKRLRDVFLADEFNLILFYDAGLAWFSGAENAGAGFDSLTWSSLKTDVGIALSDSEGRVRLNLARRLDGSSKDIVVTFRINRAF
ncbi:MAG TPA: hypothetical protein ENJ29_12450 [Bacteroidetes bacterium]|nr:hypothetical protein [Bacteroidota bacterium]